MEICVIKLGAKGDVVRTLPIIKKIKESNGGNLTLITKKDIKDLLKGVQFIDKIEILEDFSADEKKFDLLYNFDIDEQATSLAQKINASKKLGFYSDEGFLSAFNIGAEYYLNTIFDDSLKKSNKKTYQQMMFEAAELEYCDEHTKINLTEQEVKFGEEFVKENNVNKDRLIGLHLGASKRWPSKAWHSERIKEFAKLATLQNYEILIFGGPEEKEKLDLISQNLEKEKIKVFRNNPYNSDLEFLSLVNVCNVMVCSDSFSLHVSLALGKPTVGLFFCTSSEEVEGYGLLEKVVSERLEEFFPEKMNEYDEDLTKSIMADQVFKIVEKVMPKNN